MFTQMYYFVYIFSIELVRYISRLVKPYSSSRILFIKLRRGCSLIITLPDGF
jgi:hypothetical protein